MATLPSAPTRGHHRAAPEAPPACLQREVPRPQQPKVSLPCCLLVMQTWHSALSPKGPRPSRLRPSPGNKGEDEVVNEAATWGRGTPVWSECPLLGTGLTFLQGPPSAPLQSSDPQEHVAAPRRARLSVSCTDKEAAHPRSEGYWWSSPHQTASSVPIGTCSCGAGRSQRAAFCPWINRS